MQSLYSPLWPVKVLLARNNDAVKNTGGWGRKMTRRLMHERSSSRQSGAKFKLRALIAGYKTQYRKHH